MEQKQKAINVVRKKIDFGSVIRYIQEQKPSYFSMEIDDPVTSNFCGFSVGSASKNVESEFYQVPPQAAWNLVSGAKVHSHQCELEISVTWLTIYKIDGFKGE